MYIGVIMKKYLFNKIEVSGSDVKFIPFREASYIESLSAYVDEEPVKNGQKFISVKKLLFIPKSFNKFLKMLSKTKLNKDGEYDIVVNLDPVNHEEKNISFEHLLKIFARNECQVKAPNKDVLSNFYSKAYQIKQETQNEKNILDTSPKDLI